MLNFLSLIDYGELLYTYEAAICNYEYEVFNYNNIETNTKIELLFKESTEIGNIYTANITEKGNSKIQKTNKINKLINDFLIQNINPIIHNWGNSEKKANNDFTIVFNYFGKEIEMTFNKSYTVVEIGPSITVFSEFKNGGQIEAYQFSKHGYFCDNILDRSNSAVFDNTFIDFKLFLKKKRVGNDLLDSLPTLIKISSDNNEHLYQLKYNKIGVVSSIIRDDINKNLFRYESFDSTEGFISRSIYPNLFDVIDINYADPSLSIWSEIEVSYQKNKIIINKNVYKIKKENLDSLINDLNSNQATLMIDILK